MPWTVSSELIAAAARAADFEILTRADIDLSTAATWDDSLAREFRLLVPVDVQAFVVPETGAESTVRVAGMPGDPAPLAPGEPRARGIHLHWAMPDGLLRGAQPEPDAERSRCPSCRTAGSCFARCFRSASSVRC